MKLKLIDALRNYWQSGANRGIEKILERSFIASEAGRVGAEGKIHADRPDGRVIPDSEPNSLHHIVEILQIVLAEAEADVMNIAIDVSGVLKQHATEIIAEQRKS